MGKGIKLSPAHGLNPSLGLCFWCGEAKDIVLFGRIHEKKGDHTDVEAPKQMVHDLEPCEKCKEKFKQGVHLIEVSGDGSKFGNNPAFRLKAANGQFVYPTGRFVVLKPEAIKDGKPGGKGLCDKETMDWILQSAHEGGEKKE